MEFDGRMAETAAAHPNHICYAPPPLLYQQQQQLQPHFSYHSNLPLNANPNPSSVSSCNQSPSVPVAAPSPNPYDPHFGPRSAPLQHALPPAPVSSHYHGGAGGLLPHGFDAAEAIRQYGSDPSSSGHGPANSNPESFHRTPHEFAALEAIRLYGVDPFGRAPVPSPYTGLESTIAAHAMPPYRSMIHPNSKSTMGKKISKGITKSFQSTYCEVCKVRCNTAEVLRNHKQGKKHKKMLQKLQESLPAKVPATKAVEEDKEREKKDRWTTPPGEDVEAKRRKLLQAGAVAEGVKVCSTCNVVVNSLKVYEYHIAGQKHAAMVKRQEQQQAQPYSS